MWVKNTHISNGGGVIKRLTDYFAEYPKSTPRAACAALNLDPKCHAATARVVKCRLKGESLTFSGPPQPKPEGRV